LTRFHLTILKMTLELYLVSRKIRVLGPSERESVRDDGVSAKTAPPFCWTLLPNLILARLNTDLRNRLLGRGQACPADLLPKSGVSDGPAAAKLIPPMPGGRTRARTGPCFFTTGTSCTLVHASFRGNVQFPAQKHYAPAVNDS
jgi:hypothetical protein